MNWIFEAYSNVYNAAMMQEPNRSVHVAPAKNEVRPKPPMLFRAFRRG